MADAGSGEGTPDRPDLVAAAKSGDTKAMDHLLRSLYTRVYGICRRMTGNDQDALDAAQDALIAIARGIHRYDGRAALSTWAYRVTTNACLDELRRRGRRAIPMAELPVQGRLDGAPWIDAAVVDRLAVDEAMVALAPGIRAAVVLRDVIGLDYAEIAEVLDIPPGTVRSRIARGRRSLAVALGRNQTGRSAVKEQAP